MQNLYFFSLFSLSAHLRVDCAAFADQADAPVSLMRFLRMDAESRTVIVPYY